MKLTPVETTNAQFKARQPKNIINLVADVDKVDSGIVKGLVDKFSEIEQLAKTHNISEIRLAPSGNNGFLINTGTLTSYLEKSKVNSAEGLYRAIEANIFANKEPAKSLRNGFNA